MVLAGPEELEFALRLFRDDSLMAKSEARRKKYFVPPSARRKIKSIAARKRAARARRKRTVTPAG
jgi:ribosomal protein S21